MTRSVPLLVPALLPHGGDRRVGPSRVTRRPLPIPALPRGHRRSTVYGMGRVDVGGRVGDRAVIRALGWAPGTRLQLRPDTGRVLLRPAAGGPVELTAHAHLRLPARARQRCGIRPGEPVLLVGDADEGTLLILAITTLDDLLTTLPAPTLASVA